MRDYIEGPAFLLWSVMRAEAAGDPGPWRQQAVLGRDRWDADALRDLVRDLVRDYATEHLADENAVLVIDETGFLKQGKAHQAERTHDENTAKALLDGRDQQWGPVLRLGMLEVPKVVATENAIRVVENAMRLVGGQSFLHGHILERLYRDARSGLPPIPIEWSTSRHTADIVNVPSQLRHASLNCGQTAQQLRQLGGDDDSRLRMRLSRLTLTPLHETKRDSLSSARVTRLFQTAGTGVPAPRRSRRRRAPPRRRRGR
jgi:hypothetical protein